MRAAGGFHANEAGWQLGDKGQHLLSGELLLHDDVPMRIDAMDTDHILCQIDPDCYNLYYNGPSSW